jgi:hypothetical protein
MLLSSCLLGRWWLTMSTPSTVQCYSAHEGAVKFKVSAARQPPKGTTW